jgi:hypothetical protein
VYYLIKTADAERGMKKISNKLDVVISVLAFRQPKKRLDEMKLEKNIKVTATDSKAFPLSLSQSPQQQPIVNSTISFVLVPRRWPSHISLLYKSEFSFSFSFCCM